MRREEPALLVAQLNFRRLTLNRPCLCHSPLWRKLWLKKSSVLANSSVPFRSPDLRDHLKKSNSLENSRLQELSL